MSNETVRALAMEEAARAIDKYRARTTSYDIPLRKAAAEIRALAPLPPGLIAVEVETLLAMKWRDVPEGPCWCALWPDEPQVCVNSPHCLSLRAAMNKVKT